MPYRHVAALLSCSALFACAPSTDDEAERMPPATVAAAPVQREIVVDLYLLRVADDDGGRAARIEPAQFSRWDDYANDVFAPAGIRFGFDPRDTAQLSSTLLNEAGDAAGDRWPAARRLGNDVAARHPGSIVVFVRHGPDPEPTGQGFSGGDLDFLVLPGFDETTVCGHQNIGLFAHEMGHFLSLNHTFSAEHASIEQAEAALAAGGPGGFDGDGIADTPPDPFIRQASVQCRDLRTLVLGGRPFELPRDNVMSYYDTPSKRLSPGQIARVRATLELRLERPSNAEAIDPQEAEALTVTQADGCLPFEQSMEPWWPERWSGGRQLLCDGPRGSAFALRVEVPSAGEFELALLATRAPDYGIVGVRVDGKPVGEPFDGYAPIVIPSGRRPLGKLSLSAAAHEVRFEVVGRRAESTGFLVGIDAIELRPTQADRRDPRSPATAR